MPSRRRKQMDRKKKQSTKDNKKTERRIDIPEYEKKTIDKKKIAIENNLDTPSKKNSEILARLDNKQKAPVKPIKDWEKVIKKKEPEKKATQSRRSRPARNSSRKKPARKKPLSGDAIVPYNFIKLNEKVVFSDYNPDLDQFSNNTGYIECELESKSLLLIGDGGDKMIDFYSVDNKPVIPGSTLRGMFRNYHQIISCSKIDEINDIYLYYRSFASKSSKWKDEYNSGLEEEKYIESLRKTITVTTSKAGLLKRKGYTYTINFLKHRTVKKEEEILKICKEAGKIGSYERRMNWEKIAYERFRIGQKCYIASGLMLGKCGLYELDLNSVEEEAIPVNELDVLSYLKDKNRTRHKDLVKIAKTMGGSGVPCFYLQFEDNNGVERVSIGNIPKMRRVYKEKIGSLVHKDHLSAEIDMNQSIFGYTDDGTSIAGRVSFADAFLDEYSYASSRKISLSAAKPTSNQLYLEQNITSIDDLKTYNDRDSVIRGHKQYWHKGIQDYNTGKENMDKEIVPVNKGAKASFRIYFENLTDEELGSLLYIFKLVDENHLLKLGMAKPLGYGSVSVSAELYISDRKQRYSKIFEEDSFYLAYDKKDMNDYLNAFDRHMKKYLAGNYAKDFNNRVSSLKIMMNKTIGYSLDKKHMIEYKTVTDPQFSDLNILPTPEKMKTKAN